MADRSEERRELFWKQLRRAEEDVQAWPEYVKQALMSPVKAHAAASTASPPVPGRTQ